MADQPIFSPGWGQEPAGVPQDLANSPFLLPRRRVIGIQDTATAVRVNMPWGPARPKYIPLSATKQCTPRPSPFLHI